MDEESQASLKASAHRYRLMVENASDGLFLTDAEATILEVGPSYRPVLGYLPAELIGLSCLDLTHPDDRPLLLEHIARCVAAPGCIVTTLARMQHHDGSWRWIESARTNLLEDPAVAAIVVNYHDVTVRIDAEKAMATAQTLFHQLVHDVRDYAIFMLDASGRVTDWNDGAARITGYLGEEVVGQHISIFYTAEDLEAGKPGRGLEIAAAEGRSEDESWRVRKDGSRFWGNEVVTASRDTEGRLLGFVKIVRDLSERKAAEDALRDSEGRLRRFHDALGVGLVAQDAEGNVTHANRAACEHLGLSLEQLQGGAPAGPWGIVQENGTPVSPGEDALTVARRTGQPVRDTIYGIYRGSLPGHWLLVHAIPLFNQRTGKLEEAVASFIDITDRLRAEEALRCAFEELESRVAQRTAELADSNEALALEINERRQIEATLRETNQRLQTLIHASPLAIIELDPEARVRLWNPAAERLFGWRETEVLGRQLPTVPPEIREQFHTGLKASLTGRAHRVLDIMRVRRDGVPFEVSIWTSPLRDVNGQIVASMGVLADIHERKQAERERRALLKRLVTAQEEERARIARELHDEMGQYLSALILGLSHLESGERADPILIDHLKETARQLDLEMDRLALDLRPPALEQKGLITALRDHLRDWTARCGIPVDFHSTGLEEVCLPLDVETTAYRVVQEGLTNVLKHARATRVSLIVERRASQLLVILEDNGRGFDVETLAQKADGRGSLGLIGMRERVALVGGALVIESSTGSGTSIFVRIPLPSPDDRASPGCMESYPAEPLAIPPEGIGPGDGPSLPGGSDRTGA